MTAIATAEDTRTAWLYFLLSVATLIASLSVALYHYPGGFDWQYTVVSALASRKHNPDGGVWFAGGLGIAMALLWPFLQRMWGNRSNALRSEGIAVGCLKIGILFGALMAIESLVSSALPRPLKKTHELLALLSFVFSYAGILTLSCVYLRRDRTFIWPSLLLALPILAIGVSQFVLYLGQRDLGWVDHSWREEGVPVWQSFAFWQWLALASLWTGIGALAWMRRRVPDASAP